MLQFGVRRSGIENCNLQALISLNIHVYIFVLGRVLDKQTDAGLQIKKMKKKVKTGQLQEKKTTFSFLYYYFLLFVLFFSNQYLIFIDKKFQGSGSLLL